MAKKDEKESKPVKKKRLGVGTWFGALMLVYGAYSLVHYVDFEMRSVRIMATVENVRPETMRGRRGAVQIYRPVFKFVSPRTNIEHSVVSNNAANSFNFQKGEQVLVEFDPNQINSTLRVAGSPSFLDLGIGIFGFALVFFGVRERWFVKV